MRYRRLGNSGLKVSEISLGTWLTLGNAVDEATGREIVATAFDCGINLIDTANVYAQGRCEEVLGRILSSRPRSSYVLATKVFFPVGEGPNDRGLSRKHIMEQCQASLRRLQTDYVDLYQCHRYDEETPLEETIRAMDDLVRRGLVLYWGFSEWSRSQIDRCLELCKQGGWTAPTSSQPQYNLLARGIERGVMPTCAAHGIGQVVWSPLAQGLLTGKYRAGTPPPPGSRASDPRQNYFVKAKAQDPELLAKVAALESIAEQAGVSVAQLALAWVLQREEVASCIVGASRPQQVIENCRAPKMQIPAEAFARIEELFPPP